MIGSSSTWPASSAGPLDFITTSPPFKATCYSKPFNASKPSSVSPKAPILTATTAPSLGQVKAANQAHTSGTSTAAFYSTPTTGLRTAPHTILSLAQSYESE
jgi:hypothetical protein